jgi:hypothetical protein
VRRCRPPSCRASTCARRHERHADRRDQPVGTTTDTNRTVDLVRRGARCSRSSTAAGSDLTDKADGVMYTERRPRRRDERRLHQGVLRQVAAGCCWPALATRPGRRAAETERHELLAACARCPTQRWRRPSPARGDRRGRRRFAPSARYWAIVGNGRTASPPPRCGSSSASSATSRSPATSPRTRSTSTCRREPLILVCAAGLVGSTADDVAKEVAIYKAHKACPIVVATEADERFSGRARCCRAGGAPGAGVRAVGHGRSPVRLRGGAGHRRSGAAAARGARGHRDAAVGPVTAKTQTCVRPCARTSAAPRRFLDGPAVR